MVTSRACLALFVWQVRSAAEIKFARSLSRREADLLSVSTSHEQQGGRGRWMCMQGGDHKSAGLVAGYLLGPS